MRPEHCAGVLVIQSYYKTLVHESSSSQMLNSKLVKLIVDKLTVRLYGTCIDSSDSGRRCNINFSII